MKQRHLTKPGQLLIGAHSLAECYPRGPLRQLGVRLKHSDKALAFCQYEVVLASVPMLYYVVSHLENLLLHRVNQPQDLRFLDVFERLHQIFHEHVTFLVGFFKAEGLERHNSFTAARFFHLDIALGNGPLLLDVQADARLFRRLGTCLVAQALLVKKNRFLLAVSIRRLADSLLLVSFRAFAFGTLAMNALGQITFVYSLVSRGSLGSHPRQL